MTPRSFEEPATAGSLGQFNEGLGPHHLVGECLKKTDHRYGAIAVRQRDLASGETMGKRVRGIVGVIVIVGVMMIVIVMMITRVRDQLTRGRRRGLTTPLSHDHEIRREQSGIHPHRMRIDRRDLLRDGPNLPPREPLHVRENPVRRGLKLADFERAVLTALPPVTRVDDPDLPTGKKGHLRFEQGESLEQRQWIGGAVQLDEKGVASALLSGEAEFDQPFETVTTGTARRDRSNRGSARRQGRRVELGVFEIVENDIRRPTTLPILVEERSQKRRFSGTEESGDKEKRFGHGAGGGQWAESKDKHYRNICAITG